MRINFLYFLLFCYILFDCSSWRRLYRLIEKNDAVQYRNLKQWVKVTSASNLRFFAINQFQYLSYEMDVWQFVVINVSRTFAYLAFDAKKNIANICYPFISFKTFNSHNEVHTNHKDRIMETARHREKKERIY